MAPCWWPIAAFPQRAPALLVEEDRLSSAPTSPLPTFLAPSRGHRSMSLRAGLSEIAVPRMCQECGKALTSRQPKFCSEGCAVAFHLATTAEELPASSAPGSDTQSDTATSKHGSRDKSRRHLALRRAWNADHALPAGSEPVQKRNGWFRASGPAVDKLREWFTAAVAPRMAACPVAEIRRATGLSTRYAIKIRQGHVPHPRHFAALAALAGVPAPASVPASAAIRDPHFA